jgi:hypothetical protein
MVLKKEKATAEHAESAEAGGEELEPRITRMARMGEDCPLSYTKGHE